MDRREAIKSTALLMGSMLSAGTLSVVLNGCNNTTENGKEKTSFSADEQEIIKRIADVIIPKTDTPGAVDTGVPPFIVMMIQDCYDKKAQENFHQGLEAYNQWCKKKYKKPFLDLSEEQQKIAVTALDKAVLGEGEKSLSFYRTFKELTLLGFFTSESGATETLRYRQTPGMYDGCMPYEEGDKAWAT